jgi:hypothetical protein
MNDTTDNAITPTLTFDPYGSVLQAHGWTETRDAGTHECSEQLSTGPSFWSTSSAVDGEPPIIVRIRDDGSVVWPSELGRLSSEELRAFAAIADRERKEHARQQSPDVFNLTPEQRALVDTLAQRLGATGIECTSDEAQMIVNLADFGRQTIERGETEPDAFNLRTKKTTELVAGNTRLSQVCLSALSKLVLRQHLSDYSNDANMRALDIIDTVLHIVAVIAPDKKKLRHPHG